MIHPSMFAGVYPTGIVYADKSFEINGDYARIAFLSYRTLELEWAPWGGTCSKALREAVQADADAIIARRGEQYQVSTCGQTVLLGGGK